jgi:lipoyl-dependent peroxiredoxin
MKAHYTTEALATGDGRNGRGRTSDGRLAVQLAIPKELGGTGEGTNPEQLFAIGYAACLHSALRRIARMEHVDVTDSAVGARVSIGQYPDERYGLAVELEITLPNVEDATASRLAEQAHQICPYSNATRGNVDVTLVVTDD